MFYNKSNIEPRIMTLKMFSSYHWLFTEIQGGEADPMKSETKYVIGKASNKAAQPQSSSTYEF